MDLTTLTTSEKRVVEFVAMGLSNKQIASILRIQEQTVKNTLSCAMRKLGVHKRAELIVAITARNLRLDKLD